MKAIPKLPTAVTNQIPEDPSHTSHSSLGPSQLLPRFFQGKGLLPLPPQQLFLPLPPQSSSAAYYAVAQGHAPSASTGGVVDQFYWSEPVPYIYISKYIYRCPTILLEQKLAFAPSQLQVPASMSSALAYPFLFSFAKEA